MRRHPDLLSVTAAAFLLALAYFLMARGIPGRFLAVLAGLGSILLLLRGLLAARRASGAHPGIPVQEVREYAIFRLDAQGRVASWNLGAERIKGWPSEEILGHPHAVFHPEEEVLSST